MDLRVGFGWDFHRLVEGRKFILGGVEIPFAQGMLGHSDADVLLHAVGDALLGAAGERDIGYHFPDTDPRYLDISSKKIIEGILGIIAKKGWRIINVDTTIIAEKPKLSGFIPAIKEEVAVLLGIASDAMGVKAKTAEGTGEIGAGKGISAYAVVLLVRSKASGARKKE